jgi:ATP synthase F1 complex assembly factor 1
MQEVKKNPFFDKYKDKIKKTNEDVETVAQKIVEARQKFNEEDPEEVKFIREKLELLEEHQDVPVKLSKKNKPTLNDIVKLDLFDGKQPEEIQLIWLEFHKSHARNTISAIVPPPALKAMTRRAAENPQFLYALPRGQGIEFVLGQWSGNDCYFTPLVTYQTYQENAPVALTIHHFTDLADTKDLVLMRGEYDPNLFTPVEAQFLAMQLQLYYGEKVKPSKEKLLYMFNHRPSEFQHMDLVAELDTI